MSILVVEQLTAGYNRLPVASEVSLRAEAGKVTALIGPNGAGKSTILKAIFGVLRPMGGSVTLAGRALTGWPAYRIAQAGLGYVPQVNNVFPTLSVAENLEMGAYTRTGDIRSRMSEIFDMFPDLKQAARRPAGELSGGQRNMLGMARALMLDPQVLLLDEPTAGLAPLYVERIWDRVRAIAAAGTGVVVVEQNVDLALTHADWAYVLIAGRNSLDGPADQVMGKDLASIFLGQAPEKVDLVPILER
ncbi:MAG TPA: ABC transporter ATP-binding protein [Chloroflexota bacterium]|nr:ABC transporter ATP-binding protein [Chloroflexota bacterium]